MIGGDFMGDYYYAEIIMIDDKGRVTIPRAIRREMGIKEDQLFRIYAAQVQGEDCICIKPIKE